MSFEQLEERRLLAAITWVRTSSGTWNTAANWSPARVPGAGDDVVIPNMPGNLTITYNAGTTAIKSLTSSENVVLSGGQLTVDGAVQSPNGLRLTNGASLVNAQIDSGTTLVIVTPTPRSSTLRNVTADGPVDVTASNANATVEGSLTLNNTLTLGSGARLNFEGDQASLLGTGTVVFGNFARNAIMPMTDDMTLVIGPNVTIRGGNTQPGTSTIGDTLGYSGGSNVDLRIEGTVIADSGRTLALNPTGRLINTGTLHADGGTLNIDGTFTRAELGAVTRVGGTINLLGTLDNTDANLEFTAASGSWNLLGGTIIGGTVTQSASGKLALSAAGGILDNVRIEGDLDMQVTNAEATVLGDLTINGTLTLGAGAHLFFDGATSSLLGSGTVVFENQNNNALVARRDNMTFTIGPDITVRGGNTQGRTSSIGFAQNWLIEALPNLRGQNTNVRIEGEILADLPGRAITLAPTNRLTNAGSLNAKGGTLNLAGKFTRADLGSVTNLSGAINLQGELDNRNQTLVLDETTGSWNLAGGTIIGGTIQQGDQSLLVTSNGGTLQGVVVNGDLDLSNPYSKFTVTGGLTLNGTATLGNNGKIFFQDTQTLDGTGHIVFQNAIGNALVCDGADMTLTIGSDIVISGGSSQLNSASVGGDPVVTFGTKATIVLNGTILADVPGTAITIEPRQSELVIHGTVEARGGIIVLARPARVTENGSLLASPTSTVRVANDLLSEATDAERVRPLGFVSVLGPGSEAVPQLMEVMSRDLGAVSEGFSESNFLYGTLALRNRTTLRLIDNQVNSPGGQPEAMYVNTLWVTAGSTLDLGNLKLYARSIVIEAGAEVKGTYERLDGGGDLPWEIPTPSGIETTQPRHDWTFQGFGGGRFSLLVNPGAGGTLAPVGPLLNWARVRLFDPGGALLASASSGAAGGIAGITNFVFPADGIYRAVVDAPPSHPNSTGNYLVLATDTTLNRRATNVVISSNQPQGISYGNGIDFTVRVSPQAAKTPPVTGSIQFQIDGVNFGQPVPLFGGVAQRNVPLLGAGTRTISAIFTSDNDSFDTKTTAFAQLISPVSLQVRAQDSIRPAGSPLALGVSYSGFVNGEDASVLRGEPVLSVDALAETTTGLFPIGISRGSLAADNYTFQFGSGTMQVTPAAPARIDVLTGANQSVIAERDLPVPLRIKLLDQFSNPVPGASVTFTAPASGPSGTFAGGLRAVTIITSETGEASAPLFTTNDIAGQYTITASVNNVSTPLAVTNVAAGAPLELQLSTNTVPETAGVVSVTLRRNTVITSVLDVNLSSSNPALVQLPASVSFAINQDTIDFNITVTDDAIAQGDRTLTISAEALQLATANAALTIVDNEVAALTMQLSEGSVGEGGTVVGTLVRNTPTDADLIVRLASDQPAALDLPAAVVIPAGQQSTTFDLRALDDFFAFGTQALTITAEAPGMVNSSAALAVSDDDIALLSLYFISGSSISEREGTATLRISRNTDPSAALAVDLSSSLPTGIILPSAITLPADAFFVDVTVQAVDDQLASADRVHTIAASTAGFLPASIGLTVEEDDVPTLQLGLSASTISEKQGSAVATLSRNTSTTESIVVDLLSDPAGRLLMPASVTIAAGAREAHFVISTVDNQLLDGTLAATLTARHANFADGVANLSITDDESLSITVTDPVVSEQGGETTVRVARNNTNIDQPLTVNLASTSSSDVAMPTAVIIPAGQASVTFLVTAIDDEVLGGLQSVTLIASASGYQSAEAVVAVQDYESISISLDLSSVSEAAGRASATITRSNSDDLTSDLLVTLTSSAPSQILLPSSVVIPAGEASVAVDVEAVDNGIFEGNREVTLSAAADGYVTVPTQLTVLEDEVPRPWLNPANSFDVNDDGFVSAIDVLLIINMINTTSDAELGPTRDGPYVDTNGDDFVTAFDALLVINYLNTNLAGEGEPADTRPEDAWDGGEIERLRAKRQRSSVLPDMLA